MFQALKTLNSQCKGSRPPLRTLAPRQVLLRVCSVAWAPFWVSLSISLLSLPLGTNAQWILAKAVSGLLAPPPLFWLLMTLAAIPFCLAIAFAQYRHPARFFQRIGEFSANIIFDISSVGQGVLIGVAPADALQHLVKTHLAWPALKPLLLSAGLTAILGLTQVFFCFLSSQAQFLQNPSRSGWRLQMTRVLAGTAAAIFLYSIYLQPWQA